MGRMIAQRPPTPAYVEPERAPAPVAPPHEPANYNTSTVSISVVAGKVYNKNICLSKVFAPVVVSPPPPRPAPAPAPKPGTAQISGEVKDSKTGRVLGDVIMRLNGEQQNTLQSGKYFFDDIPTGAYRLSAEKEGYKSFTWSINLRSKDDVKKDISIEPLPLVPDMNVMNRITGWQSKIHSSQFDYNTMFELPWDFIYPKGKWSAQWNIPGVAYTYQPEGWIPFIYTSQQAFVDYMKQLSEQFGGPPEAFYRIKV